MNFPCTILEQDGILSVTKWVIKVPSAKSFKWFLSENEWQEIMTTPYNRVQDILYPHYQEAKSSSIELQLKQQRRDEEYRKFRLRQFPTKQRAQ